MQFLFQFLLFYGKLTLAKSHKFQNIILCKYIHNFGAEKFFKNISYLQSYFSENTLEAFIPKNLLQIFTSNS